MNSIKEEALDSLKALGSASVDAKGPPSPVQALLGGISAGVITLILYKFATTVDAGLNRQSISDNYSVCLSSLYLFFLLHSMLVENLELDKTVSFTNLTKEKVRV